jgi:hypothetical protein
VARLTATFHFEVRDLLVLTSALGATAAASVDGQAVRFILPLLGDDGRVTGGAPETLDDLFPKRPEAPLAEGTRQIYGVMTMAGNNADPLVSVSRLRVEVDLDDAECSADAVTGRAQDFDSHVGAAIAMARDVADRAVALFVDWVRVAHRQHWLGIGGEAPVHVGRDDIRDVDAMRRLAIPPAASMSMRIVETDVGLDLTMLPDIARRVSDGYRPPLAEALLADAGFAIQGKPPDSARALLGAAVACEVKVKTFLRTHASSEQEGLLELLLSNPRDWSLAAAALLDKPLQVLTGARFREHDGGDLRKRITKLFERRNQLAHLGRLPPDQEAQEALKSARELFEWLDSISPTSFAGTSA